MTFQRNHMHLKITGQYTIKINLDKDEHRYQEYFICYFPTLHQLLRKRSTLIQ